MHKIEERKLINGARLINVIVKDLPISMVSVWFRAGSRFDPQGKNGLAHFLEHILLKRTKKFPDEIERLKALESRGIKFNAYTSYETVHFYNIQQKEETFPALEFLLDNLNDYILDQKDIELEKKVVLNEMQENKLSPREYIWNLSNQALWKNSAMGNNFFGTEESINSLKTDDLAEFVKLNYNFENCTFVVVGNEDTDKLAKFIIENLRLSDEIAEIKKEDFKNPEKISIHKNNNKQVTLAIAFKTSIDNIEEIAVLDFIRDYLANKWISKLIEELRLKGNITYWVDGESVNFSDTGMLRFIYSCDRERVTESVGIVLKEIEKIKANSFLNENLEVYRKSCASSLAIRFADPYEYLWWYGWQATVGGKDRQLLTVEEYSEQIQKITAEDMQRIAAKYLTEENLSISAIGDIEEESLVV